MKPFQILIAVVWGIMAISIFYFVFKANKIGWKYRDQWPEIRSALSVEEGKIIKKHLRKAAVCFVTGVVVMVILFYLHGTGRLFAK